MWMLLIKNNNGFGQIKHCAHGVTLCTVASKLVYKQEVSYTKQSMADRHKHTIDTNLVFLEAVLENII